MEKEMIESFKKYQLDELLAIRKKEFPFTERYTYFNNAGIGVGIKSIIEDTNSFSLKQNSEPPLLTKGVASLYDRWHEMVSTTRNKFARLVNAEADEISFQLNASAGVNIVAQMLPWEKDDNIIVTDLEYPSGVYPWYKLAKKGVQVKIIESNPDGYIDLKDIENIINKKTKLIYVSQVSFVNGFVHDLEALGDLAKQYGSYLFVDATQGLGYLNVDVRKMNIDFFTTANFKWLMGSFGSAEFYCRKEIMDLFESPVAGWLSPEDPWVYDMSKYQEAKTSRKFEPGNLGYSSIYMLNKSMDFLSNLGDTILIKEYSLYLAKLIAEGVEKIGGRVLSPVGDKHSSAILFIVFDKVDAEKLARELYSNNIIVTARNFGYSKIKGLRVSPYFYNTIEEVNYFLTSISSILNDHKIDLRH